MGLGSRDPYGAFLARFLTDGYQTSPLADEGLLCFIVSDTFMTIKTHFELREKLMDNYIHKMIRVHKDTFGATVNTAITLCERNEFPLDEQEKKKVKQFDENHTCLMVDLTQTSIHKEHDRFIQLLDKTVQYTHPLPVGDNEQSEVKNGILFMRNHSWTSESSEEYALYSYPQSLINRNSNKPFFVASPKLFGLMVDDEEVATKKVAVNDKDVTAREIIMNGQAVEVVKLGQIADVKVGLQTGDNDSYLYQNPEARGTYGDINEYRKYLLTEEDLETIQNDENLRLSVIENGISKDDPSSDRYFAGRYVVPYDKGGESDSGGGWLPNYFVQANYFINWDELHASTLISEALLNKNSTKPYPRNKNYYFINGISFSDTGEYSPTYRINFGSVFDQKGSCIIPLNESFVKNLLGVLSTRLTKYFVRTCINNTVSSHVDCQKEIPIIYGSLKSDMISNLVDEIITKQQKNKLYDYSSNEQIEINHLIYEKFGFGKLDILEVENWYARRYPKLVQAQKENLKVLGKPTDYVELYEEVEEEAEKDI
jgi:hypothetical protein